MNESITQEAGRVFPLGRLRRLIQLTAAEFNITEDEIRGRRHSRPAARPRQVVMALAHARLAMSLSQVGEAMDRDHTTVAHAVKTIREMRAVDDSFDAKVCRIEAQIGKNPMVAEIHAAAEDALKARLDRVLRQLAIEITEHPAEALLRLEAAFLPAPVVPERAQAIAGAVS